MCAQSKRVCVGERPMLNNHVSSPDRASSVLVCQPAIPRMRGTIQAIARSPVSAGSVQVASAGRSMTSARPIAPSIAVTIIGARDDITVCRSTPGCARDALNLGRHYTRRYERYRTMLANGDASRVLLIRLLHSGSGGDEADQHVHSSAGGHCGT